MGSHSLSQIGQADSKLVISSLVRRSAVHLLKLDVLAHTCSSVALDITRKVTEFMFREKDSRGALSRNAHLTAHNCLMDCHADVWTRFPVLPAVQRATISSNDRCRRSILFVTDRDHNRYQPHFADMIETFERTTKKPTGDKLSTLQVSAMTFDPFIPTFLPMQNGMIRPFSRLENGSLTFSASFLSIWHSPETIGSFR
jgi:hypothetical protein